MQEVSEIGDNRMGANLTIPIPMRDFAKFKILECSAIGQQMNWIEPCVPTTFEILFCMLLGSMSSNNGPAMVVQFRIKHIKLNVKYS